jgi:hypothetical protein
MTSPKLFHREASVVETGERILSDPRFADDPMREVFADLLSAYAKLHRQSARLVRISDRWQRDLRDLNELKNKFLGIAAHDLRNPAGAIRSLSWLLLEGGLDEATKVEFLRDIHRLGDEMLTLLDDLLNVSLIESGRLQLRPAPADLAALVQSRIKVMSMISRRKEIAIVADLEVVPECSVDRDRLGQVIDNLISNAVKFSDQGSTVRVGLKAEDSAVRIRVQDQGPGIPPEDQDQLFRMYRTASAEPTAGESSTGLGLAIAKKVVDAHGGQIALESTVGIGSTFTVSLPLHPTAGVL